MNVFCSMLEWKLEIEITQKMTRTLSLAQNTKMAKQYVLLMHGALSFLNWGLLSGKALLRCPYKIDFG